MSRIIIRAPDWSTANDYKDDTTPANINALYLEATEVRIEMLKDNNIITVNHSSKALAFGKTVAKLHLIITISFDDATYTDFQDLTYAFQTWDTKKDSNDKPYCVLRFLGNDSDYWELPFTADNGRTWTMREPKCVIQAINLREPRDGPNFKLVGTVVLNIINPKEA